MKNITKGLLSAVLVLVLILSLTLPAAATEGDLNLPDADVTNLYEDALTEAQLSKQEGAKALGLSFAMQFSAKEPTADQLAAYGDWYADFVITFEGIEDGSFDSIRVSTGGMLSGKGYMDYCDKMARRAYYENDAGARDFMYYLWCGKQSPLFGRARMTTFERYFIE